MSPRTLRRSLVPALAAGLALGLGVTAPATGAPVTPAPAAVAESAAAAAVPTGAATHRRPAERPADPVAHDPTMAREGGWYYVVITGDATPDDTYLPMKRSRDLVHWEELGPVSTQLEPWVLEALGVTAEDAPRDAWAPDLSWTGTEWRLYYAASQFGTNNSVIGLMTTPSLADPQWVDQGLVVRSEPGVQTYNAIDPEVVTDADGQPWLAFGSFFSGTHLVRLDPATGKPLPGETPVQVAQRETPPNPNAAENPAIVRHGGFYYLFLSFDYCCRGLESDYRTVVGRSASITGPYVDADGVPLLHGKGGTEVMRGYNEFVGAGGADVLLTRGGRAGWVVNHYYDATDGGTPRLNVRPLTWGADGWPEVGEPLNPSRSVGHGEAWLTIVPRGGDEAGTVVENAGCGYEGADVALWTDLGTSCQQWQVADRGEGSRLTNRFSNNVAEVAGCDNRDGGDVAQWGWVGFLENNDCQRWELAAAGDGWTSISSVLPGARAWTVEGVPAPGADVVVSSPTGGPEQQFRFDPVGEVLLASPTDGTRTLGVRGCRDRHGNGTQVRWQERDMRACQTWTLAPVAGTATYTVTSAATGRVLVPASCRGNGHGRGHGGGPDALRLVDLHRVDAACTAWTLVPGDEGTWTLANAAGRSSRTTQQEVRVLLP